MRFFFRWGRVALLFSVRVGQQDTLYDVPDLLGPSLSYSVLAGGERFRPEQYGTFQTDRSVVEWSMVRMKRTIWVSYFDVYRAGFQ